MERTVARRPSLRQLEYLVAIADCRHFGEAARKAAVSQPTLSLQIKALEDSVGAKLVERTRNNVAPTPTGEIVVHRAREILLQIDDLMASVNRDRDNLGGLIRLGTAPTVGPYLLPRIVPQLHAAFPALKIHIREALPAQLEALVSEGSIDLALVALPAIDGRLSASALIEERLLIGLPREHPLSRARTIKPEDLAGEKFLTLGRGHRLYDHVDELARRHGAEVLEDYEGTSLDALRQMVALGMGLSVFPEHYAASEIAGDPSVVVRPLEASPLVRHIGFIWRATSARANDYAALVAFARTTLGQSNSGYLRRHKVD